MCQICHLHAKSSNVCLCVSLCVYICVCGCGCVSHRKMPPSCVVWRFWPTAQIPARSPDRYPRRPSVYMYHVRDRNRARHIQPHYVYISTYIHKCTPPEPVAQIDSLVVLLCTCIKFVTEIELVIFSHIHIYVYNVTKYNELCSCDEPLYVYIYVYMISMSPYIRIYIRMYVHVYTYVHTQVRSSQEYVCI